MHTVRYLLLLLCLLVTGCGTVREVPVKEAEKVVVKDSLIYRTDTVVVEVPEVILKEVLPDVDTSVLKTDFAVSEAYLDTAGRMLHHTLEQVPQEIEKEIEVQEKIVTVEKIVDREIPVEVPKPYTPKWAWILLCINIGIVCFVLGRLIFRHTR